MAGAGASESGIVGLGDLLRLVGRWEGVGHAAYPTIEPADYREELVFRHDGTGPLLRYFQRAWRASPGNRDGEPLFQECGFLIDREDGTFEMVSAQWSGRTEVLRGPAARDHDGRLSLDLASVAIGNDDRVLRSARRLELGTDTLVYRLRMSTRSHPAGGIHLRARLRRVDPEGRPADPEEPA